MQNASANASRTNSHQMLTIAHEREGLYSSVKVSTKGVAFFGTPHCGANIAHATRVVRNIVSLCTAGSFRADLLKNLETNSAELVEVAAQFVERAVRLRILTIYEGRPVGAPVGPVVSYRQKSALHVEPADHTHQT